MSLAEGRCDFCLRRCAKLMTKVVYLKKRDLCERCWKYYLRRRARGDAP